MIGSEQRSGTALPKERKKVWGTPFQKGKSGNEGGRPKKDPIIRKFQETKYKDFIDKLQMFGSMSKGELKELVKDNSIMAFDAVFARVLFDSMEGKDKARDCLFDRLWGKVKEANISVDQFSAEHELMRRIPVIELIGLARKYIQPPQEDPHDV